MAQEFTPQTDIGNIPSTDEFQRVKDSSIIGKTGEPERNGFSGKISDVAQTVQGVFANHSEKLFAITALVGFTLIFYSGNIKAWNDFWRYTAFLGVVLIFYVVLLIGKKIVEMISKKK